MDKFIEVTNNIVGPITYLGSYCTDIKTGETLWEIRSSNKILLNTHIIQHIEDKPVELYIAKKESIKIGELHKFIEIKISNDDSSFNNINGFSYYDNSILVSESYDDIKRKIIAVEL